MYKVENGKKITAAIVIIGKAGDILGCHSTGKPKDSGYDFPKGCVEEGETDIDAAVRECFEETNIKVDKEKLIDCEYPYLHLQDRNHSGVHSWLHIIFRGQTRKDGS